MNPIETAYLSLLKSVQQNSKPFVKYAPLVAHYPMRGLADKVDVMFIGRALNDWTWQFDLPDADTDLGHLLERIKSNVKEDAETVYLEREQLNWVDDCDAKHPDYNSKRSQFWQTIKEVMHQRGAMEKNWWHGIVWSNFLKLSRSGSNPTAGMVKVIGKPSLNLLLAEIEAYRPKHVVCLSGLDYAADLLARCATTVRLPETENTRYVEYAGRLTFAAGMETNLLIMPHPQGRVREVMVAEITEQLIKLETER